MNNAWILAGQRTPIGRFLGDFAALNAPILAGACFRASLDASHLPTEELGELIVGNVLSAGVGQAPGRQVVQAAGLPESLSAASVNKVCGSGLYAVMLAARGVKAGAYQAALAGGMECMSQAPHLLRQSRQGWKFGSQPMLDSIESDGLLCAQGQTLMGNYAEKVAEQFSISRADQDQWALESHSRAIAAQNSGAMTAEIVPIHLPNGTSITRDASPRSDSTLEKLSRLKPAFGQHDASVNNPRSNNHGTVTAGNASALSDGAASVLVASDKMIGQLQPKHAFRIVATSVVSLEPSQLFIAPVFATQKVLAAANCKLHEVDLFEINEAFASQTLACIRQLGVDPQQVNVHGGAIALGHPIGCSGARILVTLMHALLNRRLRRGVATICIGGGEAIAMLIENANCS